MNEMRHGRQRAIGFLLSMICAAGLFAGCGGSDQPQTTAEKPSSKGDTKSAAKSKSSAKQPKAKFQSVTLGGDATTADTGSSDAAADDKSMDSIVRAMQPLQIMLGKWRGTTNRKVKGFSATEDLEWVWDFRTDRAHPALVVKSEKGPYLRDGRLTYLTDKQSFQLTATAPDGAQHVMEGKFENEPEEVTGDDNKPQRTYKLVLTETEPSGEEAWQVAFDQQENNRYLFQLSRKKGSGSFKLADTVGTQRTGTSFAASDDDYGEKKCVISGGLGTTTVSYNGKTYWVCCSGCQAAFNEDPQRWVAKREKEEAEKAKANQN